MLIVRALFTLRRIPYSKEMTLREFFGTPPFLIQEEAPQEMVIGTPAGFKDYASTPEEFRASERRGTTQAIANFRVDATESGSLISTETWIETFGRRARWLFRIYWLIVGPFSALIRREFLRTARKMAEG